jgi:ABC-type transporter Mla subunit MlaD
VLASRRQKLLVGGVMLTLSTALVVVLVSMGNRPVGRGFVLHVDFDNVDNLKEGAEVRISALEVGRVLAVRHGVSVGAGEPAPLAQVRVDVWLRRDMAHLVRRSSVFYVNAKGVFGERYLEVGPAERPAPTVAAGAILRGVDAPKLDRLLQFGHDNLRAVAALARELAPDIRELARSSRRVRRTLERDLPPEKVRRVLESLRSAAREAEALEDTIRLATLDGRLARSALRAADRATTRTRRGLETLPEKLPVPEEMPLSEWRDQVSRAVKKLKAAADRADRLRTRGRALLAMVRKGRGTIGRILADPELVDEIKATHKLLKQTPWRTLGRPKRRPRR